MLSKLGEDCIDILVKPVITYSIIIDIKIMQ